MQDKLTVLKFWVLLNLRIFLMKCGFKRRYGFFGPKLDRRVCQKLFDDLSFDDKDTIINAFQDYGAQQAGSQIPVFLHMQKCAGTSVNAFIERNIPEPYYFCGIYDRPVDGYDDKSFVYKIKNPFINMIEGHFDVRLLDIIERKYTAFIFLRDPIDRAISHYHYTMQAPEDHELKHIDLPLSEIIKSRKYDALFNNYQVRTLSGNNYEPVDRYDLEEAKQNLKTKFSLIGTVETCDEDIVYLSKLFNWPISPLEKVNVTRSKTKERNDQDLQSLVREFNELDIELYEYAQSVRMDIIHKKKWSE